MSKRRKVWRRVRCGYNGQRTEWRQYPLPRPRRISVTISGQTNAYLKQLVATGLYGRTKAEAAERLMCEALRKALGIVAETQPRSGGSSG